MIPTKNVCFSGTLNEVKEMKGLDIVRRDWCDLAKDSGKYVFDPLCELMNMGSEKQKNRKIVKL